MAISLDYLEVSNHNMHKEQIKTIDDLPKTLKSLAKFVGFFALVIFGVITAITACFVSAPLSTFIWTIIAIGSFVGSGALFYNFCKT